MNTNQEKQPEAFHHQRFSNSLHVGVLFLVSKR